VLLWRLGDLCKRDERILATIDAWDNGMFFFWIGLVKRVDEGDGDGLLM
jgi:hypothetical protein